MKLQKISTLLVFSMFAMVAKSQSFWTDSKFAVSPTKLGQDILGLEKDGANFVKIYTYQTAPGYYELNKKDNGEPKKKGMAALKAMAKEEEARSKQEDKKPGFGVINITELQPNGKPNTIGQFVSGAKLKADETYTLSDKTAAYRIIYRDGVTNTPIDPAGLAAKYPFLHLQDAPVTYSDVNYKGDGFLQNKNVRVYVEAFQKVNMIDSITSELKMGTPYGYAAKKVADADMIADYFPVKEETNPVSFHSEKLNVDALWNTGAKESYDMYKNYKIIFYTNDGKIIKTVDKKFDFLRNIKTFMPVYNEKREVQGIFVAFGPQMAFGKKSMKDPVENRVNVVYFDTEGNEKFAYTVEKGDKGNSRAFDPQYILAKDGKFTVYNYNGNKIFKPIKEIFIMDGKGISEPTVNTGSVPAILSSKTSVDIGDNRTIAVSLYATQQKMSSLGTPDPAAAAAAAAAKYEGLDITLFDWNGMKSVCYLSTKDVPFNTFESIDYIGEVDGKHLVVISTDTNNFVATIGNDGVGKLLNVCNIEKKQTLVKKAIKLDNVKNYYVNKDKKIIYFAYMAADQDVIVRGIAY